MMKSSLGKLWRNKLALAVTASVLAIGYVPQTFAATYTNQTIWGTDRDKTTFGSAVTKDAAGNYVYDFGEAATFKLSGSMPRGAITTSDIPSSLVINSDLTVTSHGSSYSSIAIKAGWPEGNFNMDGNQRGKITINGDLTIRDASVEGGWGVTAENIHGNYADYKGARWQPVGVKAGLNGDILLNGDIDLAVRGSALVTDPYYTALNIDDYALSTITTTGNVNIETPEDYTEAFYSIANYGGTINVNTDGTNVGDKKVVIKGNIITMADDGNGGDYYYRNGRTNIALTTSDSSWTGVVDNSGKSQAGEVNLWVQNNASWNHKALSMTDGLSHKTMPTPSVDHYGDYDGISHINKFVGGSSAANQGYIFQNDTADINIKNYSGYTTVFYEHESAGTEAENYKAGDIVIGTAAKDSSISLVTANNGIDTENSTVVNSVLNTLAGKLTYSDYSNNPDNLAADVKIAGGLTADSVTLKSGAIQFTEDGKGTYSKVISNFATSLTGNAAFDTEYSEAGVIQTDGSYKFTEDSAINVSGEVAKAIKLANAAKIDAAGKELTLNVLKASGQNAGIMQDVEGATTVTADKLKINVESTSSNGAYGICHTKGNLTVNGNTEMKIDGTSNTMGVYSKADTVFNGDVKIEIDGHNGGYAEYGASGLYATANTGGGTGGTITVNGNVDISGNANGLYANIGGATINVKGGNIDIKEAAGASSGYSALYAANGVINMNVVKDETGNVTGADNNKVTIKGNAVASIGAVNPKDIYTKSTINLGLSTADSSFTGVVYNQFPEGGKESGGKTFTGDVNLWLQNGATWNNEVVGKLPTVWGEGPFNGSHVTQLNGGKDYSHSGYIYQKDANGLTIDNYSGSTIIVYDHGDTKGTEVADYTAGNTTIKKAAEGSLVTLSTSSKNVDLNDRQNVENVMSALAQKLVYSSAGSDTNLTGQVQIAGGLTSDRIAQWLGDMSFDTETGIGSFTSGTSHKPYTTSESEFVKGARTAMMSNMMSWRDVAGDNYNRRAALLKGDEQGAWARTYGGQTKYSGNNTSFDGSYWAGQVGYDKNLADGWTMGVAIDYLDGSDNYQTGDGDTKLYSFGVYSSKDLGNNSYLDLTAKVGHVKNEFSASNETGRLEGDYSANGYSLSAQYGKRFGDIASGYIEPQLQLTWARLGSADYTAHSQQLGSVDINQDAFNSFVGRIGVEAGQASKHGNYFARLSMAHEFAGDVDTHFLDEFGGTKDTSYDLGGTWSELTLGGSYNLSKTANFFADVTKSLTGDYKHDWKVNAGLRFTF